MTMPGLGERPAAYRSESPAPGALLVDIDIATSERPRAVRSRLHQAMAELSAELHRSPAVGKIIAIVWLRSAPASSRDKRLAIAAAEAVHCRAEMRRGTPLALAVVFADPAAASHRMRERVRADALAVPDGVAGMSLDDVCAYGVRACAAAARI